MTKFTMTKSTSKTNVPKEASIDVNKNSESHIVKTCKQLVYSDFVKTLCTFLG
jgi:hypothetical protein